MLKPTIQAGQASQTKLALIISGFVIVMMMKR